MISSFLTFFLFFISSPLLGDSIALTYHVSQKIPLYVIQADFNNPNVQFVPQIVKNQTLKHNSINSTISGITGSVFCPKSLQILGTIKNNDTLLNHGIIGNGIGLTFNHTLEFINRKDGISTNWANYSSVITGGPTLIQDSTITLNPRKEGFKTLNTHKTIRTAIGILENNKLLLICTLKPITLTTLAKIMLNLSCKDAICMDGGSSSFMVFKGQIKQPIHRTLTNIVTVQETKNAEDRLFINDTERRCNSIEWFRQSIPWYMPQYLPTSGSCIRLQQMFENTSAIWNDPGGSRSLF